MYMYNGNTHDRICNYVTDFFLEEYIYIYTYIFSDIHLSELEPFHI